MNKKDNQNFMFQLSNKSRSNKLFVLFIASGIFFSGIGIYLASREDITLLVGLVFAAIVYFILFSKIRPSFVEFIVDENSFQFNYYPVSSVAREYQSVEISFASYHDFMVKESLNGWKKELILTVESKYGLADYPPISISILTKPEIEQIVFVLNKIKNR